MWSLTSPRTNRISGPKNFRSLVKKDFFNTIGTFRTCRDVRLESVMRFKDGVIGRPSLWIAEDFWVLRFRLMVKRGPWLRPQASEGEAQHGPFCWIGRIGQGDQHLHCG